MANPAAPMTADDTSSAEGADGLSQGYVIEISCLPDGGYKVSKPEPLQDEAEEEQGEAAGDEMGQDFDNVGDALKAVIALIKGNPMGDDNAQFEAGYAAR